MKRYLKFNEISYTEEVVEIDDIENYFKEKNYKVVDRDGELTYWVCDMNSPIGTEYTFTEMGEGTYE